MLTNLPDVLENYSLKQYTTLKIGGDAKYAYCPKSLGTVMEIDNFHTDLKEETFIIGAGSNLLISSQGIDGVAILTKNLTDIVQIEDDMVYAQCGAKSSSFAKFLYEQGLGEGEFLIGIPGCIGGAVFMNAGAHGQSIDKILYEVKVFDKEQRKIYDIKASELDLKYRNTTFSSGKYYILAATFKMPKKDKSLIKEKMDFHVDYRAEHHPPLTQYSAGSTFKNPEGEYAANLLESVGAKQYIENNKVRFSEKHANFLYNFNYATSSDVINLMYTMWKRVYDKYNIKLEPEIKFIGKKSEREKELWEIMTKH